ncbi:MAG: CHAT domain-containing protein [Cyanobacteria bacterium J06627_28]
MTATVDNTGTIVTQTDQQFEVTGGSLVSTEGHLFHSFQRFEPNVGESVNFVTDPAVQTVFARVTGGSPAIINGELQVSGSQANLFLMNPAGVFFGPQATLNLPGNLTVTTADAIGFDRYEWFHGSGRNDYDALAGSPDTFAFLNRESGVVVNEGDLALGAEQQLTMVGGHVTNLGSLAAPGGTVTVAAIPGEQIVRINQEGHLLNLEIANNSADNYIRPFQDDVGSAPSVMTPSIMTPSIMTPLSLPELLTSSGDVAEVTQLTVNTDGTVSLLGSTVRMPTQSGTTVLSGRIDVAADHRLPTEAAVSSQMGGTVSVLGDRVALLNAHIEASGPAGGGAVRIGGDYQGQGTLLQARDTVIDGESAIAADALNAGNGGTVIAWGQNTTQFLGEITATGGIESGDGGFVEVSGKRELLFQGIVDVSARQGALGSLLLDPETIRIVDEDLGSDDAQLLDNRIFFTDEPGSSFTISEDTLESLAGNANLILEASDHIILEDLSDNTLALRGGTGSIIWKADADQNGVGDILVQDRQDTIVAPGRSISFSGNSLELGPLTTVANPNLSNSSGNITLQANQSIETRRLRSQNPVGNGGSVSIAASGSITTGLIHTAGAQSSGDVTITSTDSTITTGEILTDTFGPSGTVSLSSTADGGSGNSNTVPENTLTEANLLGGALQRSGGRQGRRGELGSRGDSTNRPRNSREGTGRGLNNAPRTVLGGDRGSAALANLEEQRVQEFSDYFGRSLDTTELTPDQVQALLQTVHAETNNQSVIVYIETPHSDAFSSEFSVSLESDLLQSSTPLEILIFTANGDPVSLSVPDVSREQLVQTVTDLRSNLATSVRRNSTSYLAPAQQLYQWLIQPIEDELGADEIDTFLFSMDVGLRSLPIAALHDGQQFLIEKYSVGMVPSLSLMDADYSPIEREQVLAMGASSFEELQPLLAVPAELEMISQLWQGEDFLNEAFTLENLVQAQSQNPAQVIHLATHAEFKAGNANNSYIQLWNEQLRLDDIHNLGWDQPAVDLLVLSACQTAIGSPEAEMGFAGLSVATGVKSALASLWAVSDLGTLALMSEFYDRLRMVPLKADALQHAQLAMLRGETRVESGLLLNESTRSTVNLPAGISNLESPDLSHPYYWSGFTMIGSPW